MKTIIFNYNNIKNNAIGNNRSQLKVSTVIDKQLCVFVLSLRISCFRAVLSDELSDCVTTCHSDVLNGYKKSPKENRVSSDSKKTECKSNTFR